MEAVFIALIGAGAGLATVFVGGLANRRLGLGQPIEEKINARLKVLNDVLEAEVEERKEAEADCLKKLAEALRAMDDMVRRLDDLEATKLRLLERLGMSLTDQHADAARERAGR